MRIELSIKRDPHYGRMCFKLKPSELYILSWGKSLVLRPRPFPQLRGVSRGGAQGARAPPLISVVVIFQPIILYTINPPVSDMLVPAPSTPKYTPLPI